MLGTVGDDVFVCIASPAAGTQEVREARPGRKHKEQGHTHRWSVENSLLTRSRCITTHVRGACFAGADEGLGPAGSDWLRVRVAFCK